MGIQHSRVEFVTDGNGDALAYKRHDGSTVGVVTAQTNPVTGGVEITAGGEQVSVGGGAGLAPDATGALADRDTHNAEDAGYIYLATDQSPAQYYIREGASGWAGPILLSVDHWATGATYVSGQSIISPHGRQMVCKIDHTAAEFDARKWIFPSDDGATVFDFGQLADGDASTVYPVRGAIDYFGVVPDDYDTLRVKDGRLEWNSDQAKRPYFYLQGELISKQEPVQHAWLEVECIAAPENNIPLLILFPGPERWWDNAGDSHRAGIHWALYGQFNNVMELRLQVGPYAANRNDLGTVSTGPQYSRPSSPAGNKIRWDITVNKATGRMRGYLDGMLVTEYTSAPVINYISPYAMVESSGPTWKILEFGMSPRLPAWDGSEMQRGVAMHSSAYLADTAITPTWKKFVEFKVAYPTSGAIDITWNPFCNCTAGRIEMDVSNTTDAPVAALPVRVCEATTNARVFFNQIRFGTPGTTETIAIWARVTNTTTESIIRSSTHGENRGPRWQPATFAPAL